MIVTLISYHKEEAVSLLLLDLVPETWGVQKQTQIYNPYFSLAEQYIHSCLHAKLKV